MEGDSAEILSASRPVQWNRVLISTHPARRALQREKSELKRGRRRYQKQAAASHIRSCPPKGIRTLWRIDWFLLATTRKPPSNFWILVVLHANSVETMMACIMPQATRVISVNTNDFRENDRCRRHERQVVNAYQSRQTSLLPSHVDYFIPEWRYSNPCIFYGESFHHGGKYMTYYVLFFMS